LAPTLELDDYNGRRAVLAEHCNRLFEIVLLDDRWKGAETICVKTAKEMMKAISAANVHVLDDGGNAADDENERHHQVTPTTTSRQPRALKRSASVMTNSTEDFSRHGNFQVYDEAAFIGQSSSTSSSSSSTSLPK
jgi:hypothetical protein